MPRAKPRWNRSPTGAFGTRRFHRSAPHTRCPQTTTSATAGIGRMRNLEFPGIVKPPRCLSIQRTVSQDLHFPVKTSVLKTLLPGFDLFYADVSVSDKLFSKVTTA